MNALPLPPRQVAARAPATDSGYPEEVLHAEWNPDLEQVTRARRRRKVRRPPLVLVAPCADWTDCLPEELAGP